MRRFTILVVVAVLFALPAAAQPAAAQQNAGPLRLSVFVSDLGYTESDQAGSDFSGGFGVGLEYRVARQWSAALSISAEEHTRFFDPLPPDVFGATWVSSMDVQTYPVDLVAQYHIPTRTRWQPYIGAGARWVHGPGAPEPFSDRLSAQISAGVDMNFANNWSVRFDAKRLLQDSATFYDPLTKVSVGVGRRF